MTFNLDLAHSLAFEFRFKCLNTNCGRGCSVVGINQKGKKKALKFFP